MAEMQFGRYRVNISNREKLFFPDAGLCKGDVVDYYLDIADILIPHLRHYGIAMQRFPDGLKSEGFYQKDCPDYFPGWLKTVKVAKRSGGNFMAPVVTNRATLAYLADQAMLTPHLYLARVDDMESPDKMVFDLDPPGDNDDHDDVCRCALTLRGLLAELDLPAWIQTTGSKGFHLVVPLDRSADFTATRQFADKVTRIMTKRHPRQYTVEQRKQNRRGRIYIDIQRNAYGATAVAPYAVRGLPAAPVATPLEWAEVEEGINPQYWTLKQIPERLKQQDDPWEKINRHARSLASRNSMLEELLADTGNK